MEEEKVASLLSQLFEGGNIKRLFLFHICSPQGCENVAKRGDIHFILQPPSLECNFVICVVKSFAISTLQLKEQFNNRAW